MRPPRAGSCAAARGVVYPTAHRLNRTFGAALCAAIGSRCRTLQRALRFALPTPQIALRFLFLGGPLAPLIDAAEGARCSRALFALDPNAALPPLPDKVACLAPLRTATLSATS